MLENTFDPRLPHRFVRYGRMSSDMENPRSPDQQFDTIAQTLLRFGHPWAHAGDYRDDAISGRYTAKRPDFRRMLDDLRTGKVDAKLILVDTFERFGRADEIASIRSRLQSRQRIPVLTADSQFADPTTSAGRALTMIEAIRSTEDGRVKAHDVLRGKRDTAARGHWPGGPAPLGYRLRSVLVDRRGGQEFDGHILVPDPETSMVPAKLYSLAMETGWGTRRLARALNADPTVPEAIKPVSAERVRQVLQSTLYAGTLTYGRCRTGIVEDLLIREAVEPGEELVVPRLELQRQWSSARSRRAELEAQVDRLEAMGTCTRRGAEGSCRLPCDR